MTLHETLGHQVLKTADTRIVFEGRFGDTLAFSSVRSVMNPPNDEEQSDGEMSEGGDATEADVGEEEPTDTNGDEPSDDVDMTPVDDTDEYSDYWISVSRDAIVVVERAQVALGAFLVLDGAPVHLIWDGVLGELTTVPLTVYTRIPLLSVTPDSCPTEVLRCVPADPDCMEKKPPGCAVHFSMRTVKCRPWRSQGHFREIGSSLKPTRRFARCSSQGPY